ncbi:hypothetical protein [Dictyobacter formicarum]|uniref:SnoaL-like domain-containing protein n=1 Tax=Dictyobacter formicarum TaxID=2778368 RepID=A0ABQ3VF36_9CHLR|nr:hypothetical protein [Dictyobacter formicarum]GHO84101.1 hypothetical protein KSZ_21070 [Dictyobacter formicarum]
MQIDPSTPRALMALLDAIDPMRMFADTQTLCTPAFAGRRVGTEGHQRATDFLVARFRGSGWHTTLEPFVITTPVLEVSSQPRLEIQTPEGMRERALVLRTEFCEHPRSASLPHGKQGRAIHMNRGSQSISPG